MFKTLGLVYTVTWPRVTPMRYYVQFIKVLVTYIGATIPARISALIESISLLLRSWNLFSWGVLIPHSLSHFASLSIKSPRISRIDRRPFIIHDSFSIDPLQFPRDKERASDSSQSNFIGGRFGNDGSVEDTNVGSIYGVERDYFLISLSNINITSHFN